jgi:biotin transport system substrate-specific component
MTTKDLTQIGLFTALISVTSWISIPLGTVPITLQTLVIMLIGVFGNVRTSALSVIAYLIIGAMGLPVFSGGLGGVGVILGPTGGFLISFVIAAVFIAFMKNVNFINNELLRIAIILVAANIIIYMFGWTYYTIYVNGTIASTLAIMWLFVFGDLLKIIIVLYAYLNMRSYVTYERS